MKKSKVEKISCLELRMLVGKVRIGVTILNDVYIVKHQNIDSFAVVSLEYLNKPPRGRAAGYSW